MLANRMQKLRQQLGFDIFVAATELDRDEHDFVQLLQQLPTTGITRRSS